MGNVAPDCQWPYGRVPFSISGDFAPGSSESASILTAVAMWNEQSIVELVPRNPSRDPDFISFVGADAWCSTKPGFSGGCHEIGCDLSLTFGDVNPDSADPSRVYFPAGAVAHEIGHVLGLHHEHQRDDRDEYLTVFTQNIDFSGPDVSHQFNFRGDQVGRYDFDSIMHYAGKVFSKNGATTMRPKPLPPPSIGQLQKLSWGDRRTIAWLYGKMPGNLLWYRYEDGSFGVDAERRSGARTGEGRVGFKVGSGWDQFSSVFATEQGVIYATKPNGDLLWYRNTPFREGMKRWAEPTGAKIGSGWDRFSSVFATEQGVIYAIDDSGDLHWYRHTGFETGAATWAEPTGAKIGSGWDRFNKVFATEQGVIYAIDDDGDLHWYRHTGLETGAATWAEPTGAKIGSGWDQFSQVVASDKGQIFAIDEEGSLVAYQHTGVRTGGATWESEGRKIGTGWNDFDLLIATSDNVLYGVHC